MRKDDPERQIELCLHRLRMSRSSRTPILVSGWRRVAESDYRSGWPVVRGRANAGSAAPRSTLAPEAATMTCQRRSVWTIRGPQRYGRCGFAQAPRCCRTASAMPAARRRCGAGPRTERSASGSAGSPTTRSFTEWTPSSPSAFSPHSPRRPPLTAYRTCWPRSAHFPPWTIPTPSWLSCAERGRSCSSTRRTAAQHWLVSRGPDRVHWTHGQGNADVDLRGAAFDLLLVLYRRAPLDTVQVRGNEPLIMHWIDPLLI